MRENKLGECFIASIMLIGTKTRMHLQWWYSKLTLALGLSGLSERRLGPGLSGQRAPMEREYFNQCRLLHCWVHHLLGKFFPCRHICSRQSRNIAPNHRTCTVEPGLGNQTSPAESCRVWVYIPPWKLESASIRASPCW